MILARSRKDILKKFDELADEVNQHLIKVLAIYDHRNESSWVKELNKWLKYLSQLNCKHNPDDASLFKKLNIYLAGDEWKEVKFYCADEDNKNNSALVYDNYKKACANIPAILREFVEDRDLFIGIAELNSFKKAIKDRGSSIHEVDLASILKFKRI